MWPLEVCNFNALFQFLALDDVFSVRLVSRSCCVAAKEACEVRHIDQILSEDIVHICDRRKFPFLISVSKIRIIGQMTFGSASLLMQKWSQWSTLFLSADTHSRRAFRHILANAQKTALLRICVDRARRKDMDAAPKVFRRFAITNSLSLLSLDARGDFPTCVQNTLFLFRSLLVLSIRTAQPDTTWLVRLCVNLPSCLQQLHVVNATPPSTHRPPHFLELLKHYALKAITLVGCITTCGFDCPSHEIILDFCETTRVDYLCFDHMRLASVRQLIRRRVEFVVTSVLVSKAEEGDVSSIALPAGYKILFCTCSV